MDMEWTRRIGVALLVLALVASATAPAAWAEEALPEPAAPEGAPPARESDGGREAAAAAINVLYVPGKAIACVLSGAFWVGAMALSLGGAYKDENVRRIINGGCGGKWVLKGEDMPSSR